MLLLLSARGVELNCVDAEQATGKKPTPVT
jgi:hypothetical protein